MRLYVCPPLHTLARDDGGALRPRQDHLVRGPFASSLGSHLADGGDEASEPSQQFVGIMRLPTELRSSPIDTSAPDLVVKQLPQQVFAKGKFDGAGLNLHLHPTRGAGKLVLFVHGLSGAGYGTWKAMPKMMFDGDKGEPVDVALFKYRSGYRALLQWGADPGVVARRLTTQLSELADRYDEIYIIAHSLGGLVAGAAMQDYLQESGRASREALTPVASLIYFASPRAGSVWATLLRALHFREGPWLKRNGEPLRRFEEFHERNIQNRALARAEENEFLIPLYCLGGERDLFVDHFSASFGIPTTQRMPLDLGHIRSAKPTQDNYAQLRWLYRIIRDVSQVRQTWTQRQQKVMNDQGMPPPPRPYVVTELRTSTSGLEWRMAYNTVRSNLSNESLEVHDHADAAHDDVDVLLTVHDADNVVGNDSDDRATVEAAEVQHQARQGSLLVGVSAVGGQSEAAVNVINDWLKLSSFTGTFFVGGVQDLEGLAALMMQYIQAKIEQHPRRSAAADVGQMLRAATSTTDPFG